MIVVSMFFDFVLVFALWAPALDLQLVVIILRVLDEPVPGIPALGDVAPIVFVQILSKHGSFIVRVFVQIIGVNRAF